MLRSSFIHVPGVGSKTERMLWAHGVRSWEDFEVFRPKLPLAEDKKDRIAVHLQESRAALERHDISFFAKAIPPTEHWRLYDEFGDATCFLDIETTGLSLHYDHPTYVGIFGRNGFKAFIEGENLEELPGALREYSIVVTFNGGRFDLQFLRRYVPNFVAPPVQIDLASLLRRVQPKGPRITRKEATRNRQDIDILKQTLMSVKDAEGSSALKRILRQFEEKKGRGTGKKSLKNIENFFGLARDTRVSGMVGADAAILWKHYVKGLISSVPSALDLSSAAPSSQSTPEHNRLNPSVALKQLALYNLYDVINLKALMDITTSILRARLLSKQIAAGLDVRVHKNEKDGERVLSIGSFKLPLNKHANLRRPVLDDFMPPLRSDGKFRRVVGIDLSGSYRRASGWATLEGRKVTTKPLKRNEDILRNTIAAKPDLVSIDSPLSLPKPGNGIMRDCERILKVRGISVYPALLPSMSRLTRRGIYLNKKLTEAGLRVIESYPGAAQDILGISRKRAFLSKTTNNEPNAELRQDLADFGFEGLLASKEVSHDELDAITSAFVGYCYLSGSYDEIGCDEENYLVIPKIIRKTEKNEASRQSGSGLTVAKQITK